MICNPLREIAMAIVPWDWSEETSVSGRGVYIAYNLDWELHFGSVYDVDNMNTWTKHKETRHRDCHFIWHGSFWLGINTKWSIHCVRRRLYGNAWFCPSCDVMWFEFGLGIIGIKLELPELKSSLYWIIKKFSSNFWLKIWKSIPNKENSDFTNEVIYCKVTI